MRYASRCRLMPSQTQEISVPRTSRRPLGSAASASAHPRVVSWSVSATTSSPASAAAATSSAGVSVPSEAELWVCRSAIIGYSVGARGAPAGSGRQAWGQRPEREVQAGSGVAQVLEHEVVDEQEPGSLRPDRSPDPAAERL